PCPGPVSQRGSAQASRDVVWRLPQNGAVGRVRTSRDTHHLTGVIDILCVRPCATRRRLEVAYVIAGPQDGIAIGSITSDRTGVIHGPSDAPDRGGRLGERG